MPVVRFRASFWCRWSVLGLHFGAWWCVLRLHFGAGGSFWGSVLVPVVRFEAPFWCLVVRYSGAPFWCVQCVLVVHFGDRFWCRWSVLGLHFPGPRFWTSSGFGGLRFWTSSGFRGLGFGPPLVLDRGLVFGRCCGFVLGPSRPTISEFPYICFKSSNHPLFASLAFVFPFAPPSFCLFQPSMLVHWSVYPHAIDIHWSSEKTIQVIQRKLSHVIVVDESFEALEPGWLLLVGCLKQFVFEGALD